MGCSTSKNIASKAPTYDESHGNADAYSSYEEETKGTDNFWTSDKSSCKPIRFSKNGAGSEAINPAKTIPKMLEQAIANSGNKPFLRVESVPTTLEKGATAPASKPVEDWNTRTYSETYEECRNVAKGFMSLGLDALDAVTIYGFNSPEWVMAEIACILAGGIAAGIYPSDTAEQVTFKARHSGAVVAVVQNKSKAEMFLSAAKDLPKLKAIVVWDESGGMPDSDGELKIMSWNSLIKLGKSGSDSDLDERIENQEPGQCCAYIYTSGTTGMPKAVMISHDNILFEARLAFALIPGMGQDGCGERIISYLPLSHVAGMMVDIISPITVAATTPGYATLHFARPYDLKAGTLGDRLRAVRPTLFLGVPRVWEKIQEKIMAKSAANPTTGIKNSLKLWALGLGLEHQNNCQLGGSGVYGSGYAIADKLVLSKVKTLLGLDACKFCFTGAAPIKTETLQFYGRLGLNINEVYGMSECTGATTWSTDLAHKWGSCGWAMPSTEVSVRSKETGEEVPDGKDGELCYRGRHIMMGYMANPDLGDEHMKLITEKNRSSIDQYGWLHSGDKGQRDVDGMIRITGRYKELIIGAGGENVAPVPVEDGVKSRCAAISNIMMYGDKMKYNVAVITLKTVGATGELPGTDELDPVAAKIDPSCTSLTQAMDSVKIIEAIKAAILETNNDPKCCPMPPSKIQKFTILPTDFSVVTEELTPTFKLKRSVVTDKYISTIKSMYDSKDIYVKYNA